MNIALDAMGGDNAPKAIIAGAVQALEELPEQVTITLVGDEAQINAELKALSCETPRFSIVHTTEVVTMDDPPTAAIRGKKNSSIAKAVELVKEGKSQALVSAGNTGASVAACVLKLGRLPGIDRPAIATVIPSPESRFVLLDSGANVDSKPEMLEQFAIMGELYARTVLELDPPRVGLFNNGSEDGKGNEVTKATFKLLQECKFNFIGNVEGTDLFKNKVDVVVCDGFIGNLVLKSCEGIAKGISGMLKSNIKKKNVRKVGYALSKGAFDELKEKTDSRATGGAPLLGVNGIFIKAHGSSDDYALKNALRVAYDLTSKELNKQIIEGIAAQHDQQEG